jgi:hypothetical protein
VNRYLRATSREGDKDEQASLQEGDSFGSRGAPQLPGLLTPRTISMSATVMSIQPG